MFSVIMISRINTAVLVLFAAALTVTAACQKVPLLAPSGSTINLNATATALSVNGSATITAQVIQASGTSPQSGTLVIFTTTLGSIQPPQAETDINGRVTVNFVAGGASGTATITASSGGANQGTNGAIKILIGTAAVGHVTVSANPASVPAQGGSSKITAAVLDVNGNVLTSAPVSFSTTAGSLSAAVVTTDANGLANTTLTTNQQATVTASVGAQATAGTGTGTGSGSGSGTGTGVTASGQASGQIIVTVIAAPTLLITPPTSPPSAGLPAAFTFTVTPAATNGSAVRDLQVTWGDGSLAQDLGVVTGAAIVSHVYNRPATYIITATVTDASGNSSTAQTAVVVIPVPRPTIIITYSPVPAHVNTQTTFSIQITFAAGIGAVDTAIDFGDGTSADLGGATTASEPKVYTAQGTYTVKVTVTDTSGQTTLGTTSVSVGL
jgi:adhesin/invasin